jgi:hypothetical protein
VTHFIDGKYMVDDGYSTNLMTNLLFAWSPLAMQDSYQDAAHKVNGTDISVHDCQNGSKIWRGFFISL